MGELLRAIYSREPACAKERAAGAPAASGDFDIDGRSLANLVAKWKGMERMYATSIDLQKSRLNEELVVRDRAKGEVCRDFVRDLEALAAAAPRPELAPAETGWLIERRDRGAIEWLVADSAGYEWTPDPNKPIRFCRRADADQVASLFDDIDVHITEHKWGL